MSCERNRGQFFAALAAEAPLAQALGGDAEATARCLTTLYETASRRTEVSPVLADALTLALFAEMRQRGLRPPTHSASGLPLPAARQGYAAVMQTLRAIRSGERLPPLAQEVRQANQWPTAGLAPRSEAAEPVLASATSLGGPRDDATAADGSRHRFAPNDPPGRLDPALQALVERQVESWSASVQQEIRAFANGNAPTEPEHVTRALSGLAHAIQMHLVGKHSRVPLVYWAREYRNSPAKQHALAVALLTTLGTPRCPTCGQWRARALHRCPTRAFDADGYNGFGVDRYGITRFGTRANGMPVPKRRRLLDAGKEFITPTDPIDNPAMADLWGRIASAVAGHECQVVLRPGEGFATDMHGTIYADPYPLGKDADPRHNLIVTKAGIYHEIAHELLTPPEDWALVLAIRDGKETVEGIEQGRRMVAKLYNITEDGRIEREMASRFAGVAETLATQCAIYPRWDERVGPGVPLAEEVIWPLLYTVLPYFRVRDEVRAAMTPEGRALFEELESIALRGALGGSEDSLTATLEIARRLEAAGIFDVPETSATPPPLPGPGTPSRSVPAAAGASVKEEGEAGAGEGEPAGAGEGARADGSSQGGAGEGGGAGKETETSGGSAGEAGAEARAAGAGTTEAPDGAAGSAAPPSAPAAPGAGVPGTGSVEKRDSTAAPRPPSTPGSSLPPTPEEAPLSDEEVERVLNDLEDQAVAVAEREISRQGRYDVLGGVLHAPLSVRTTEPIGWSEPGEATVTQRYRSADGRVVSVETSAPVTDEPGLLAGLARRRATQGEIAGRLARRLDSIRQESIARLRLQTEGALDRRRLPAAIAGRQEVRTRLRTEEVTGMAVSLLVDQSGSMEDHILDGKLYDATCVVSQALEQLEIPYEVRGHGGLSTQYKAMDEPTLAPERAARLVEDITGSNEVTAPVVGLATTALLARPDQNRLIVNLMDGDMDDHAEAVAHYEAARKAGVVAFGVFLGKPNSRQIGRMTELFGQRNWRPIGDLKELPAVVGQRIADIFESLGGEG
jgi:hypothetical protein